LRTALRTVLRTLRPTFRPTLRASLLRARVRAPLRAAALRAALLRAPALFLATAILFLHDQVGVSPDPDESAIAASRHDRPQVTKELAETSTHTNPSLRRANRLQEMCVHQGKSTNRPSFITLSPVLFQSSDHRRTWRQRDVIVAAQRRDRLHLRTRLAISSLNSRKNKMKTDHQRSSC